MFDIFGDILNLCGKFFPFHLTLICIYNNSKAQVGKEEKEQTHILLYIAYIHIYNTYIKRDLRQKQKGVQIEHNG